MDDDLQTPAAPATSARAIFAASVVGMLVCCICGTQFPALLRTIAREFDLDVAQRGRFFFCGPIGFMISTLLSGRLSDLWGRRVFVLAGFGSLGIGMLLAASAAWDVMLMAGLFFIGGGSGFVMAPLTAAISEAFTERRASVVNALHVFAVSGAVSGPLIAGFVLWMGWAWRCAFLVGVALAAVAWVTAFRVLPKGPARVSVADASSVPPRGGHGLVLFLCIAIFLYVGAEQAIIQWSANYLSLEFALPDERAAPAVSGIWFGMVLGRALYVFLTRRFGYLPLVVASALLAALAAAGAGLAGNARVAALLMCAAGFVMGGSWPTIVAYATHRRPHRMGTDMAFVVAAGALGPMTMPPLAGWLAKHTAYGLRAAMAVAVAGFLLEAIVLVGVWVGEGRITTANGE